MLSNVNQKRNLDNLETLGIDSEACRHVEIHVVNKHKSEEKKTKERHKVKLERLKIEHEATNVDRNDFGFPWSPKNEQDQT